MTKLILAKKLENGKHQVLDNIKLYTEPLNNKPEILPINKICMKCRKKSDKIYCHIGIKMRDKKKYCRYSLKYAVSLN